jgi:hypothetical protein
MVELVAEVASVVILISVAVGVAAVAGYVVRELLFG